jgi:hypothetical protein
MGRTLTTAAILFGLVSLSAPAYATSLLKIRERVADEDIPKDAPRDTKVICKTNPSGCSYMPQNDAFSTAGEQALFLGVYQQSFGPYGSTQGEKQRNELLKKTAVAINDCLAGSNCGPTQQELVLKALIQYNLGQDIKHMMLTNNSNASRMRSVEDYKKDSRGKTKMDPEAIERSLAQGKKFTYQGGAENLARANRGESSQSRVSERIDMSRSAGSASEKKQVFSVDEQKVGGHFDRAAVQAQEIFGEKYVKDFGAILDFYSQPNISGDYVYVKTKDTYVYDESSGRRTLDPASRLEEIKEEQQRFLKSGKPLADLKKKLSPVQFAAGADGKPIYNASGLRRDATGVGQIQTVDPNSEYAKELKVKFDDLPLNSPTGNAKAVTRVLNAQFKASYEKDLAEQTAKKTGRNTASASMSPPATPSPETAKTVYLDPKKFDDFLNEIWPSSAARQARIQAP